MKNASFHTVNDLLTRFNSISLDEMDGVKLMDRTDVKFVMSFDKLGSILALLEDHYRVLTIEAHRVFSYRTDYYDTPDLNMFFDHHNGKLNRFKIRQREYVESSLSYLEVKFKSNKGRVLKERIESSINDEHAFTGFVKKHTPYNPQNLNLTVINHFNRFTLVDNRLKERVTVDFNLSFSNKIQHLLLKGLVIIEVKQDRKDKNSIIFDVLKRNMLRPASISKYCLGVSLLNEQSKFNNFKKTLLMINKLSHVELSA
jgi:hypothetical protein